MDYFTYPLFCALIANALAQILKVFIYKIRTGAWNWHWVLSSGGFPSSHSSTVTALSLCIGFSEGFKGSLFAVTVIFSLIVIYDACHVRYYSGKNIEMTLSLINDLEKAGIVEPSEIYQQKMKTVLGHKVSEVIGGIVVGMVVAFMPVCLHLF